MTTLPWPAGPRTTNQAALQRRRRVDPTYPSDRDIEIITLAALGYDDTTIGQEMSPPLSVNTIKTHLRKARHRAGASRTVHLIAIALRQGWITYPGEPLSTPYRPTAVQLEIVTLASRGLFIAEIGAAMSPPLSVNTIKYQLRGVFEATRTNNVKALTALAIHQGWIT